MLMLEHVDKLAETSAQAIANIKFDKVIVWENGGGNSARGDTAPFLPGPVRSTAPMMQVLKDIGGVEIPDYLARLKPEPSTPNGATTAAAPAGPAGAPSP